MSFLPRFPRIFTIYLALVLAGLLRPAEGFMLFEQREKTDAPLAQLQAQPGQTIINLNGQWEYRIGESGPFRQGWIPCAFEGNDGIVAFRRRFALPDSFRSYQIQLHLPEVNYAVEVWVNGTFISSFTGGNLAFSCLVPRDRLRFRGENDIELRIDNHLTPRTTFPPRTQLLHPQQFGGVFSGAYLRAVPAWSLEDLSLSVDSPWDSLAVCATAGLRIAHYRSAAWTADTLNAAKEIRAYTVLKDSSGRTLAEGWSDHIARGGSESFHVSVRLPKTAVSPWAPGRPVLYELTATLMSGSDTLQRLSRRVGFKDVQIKGGAVFLNGRQLYMRGIDYVPEHLDGHRALSRTVLRQDLTRIKDLGFNVVRVPFGSPPLALLDLADEMGMLILAETSLNGIPGEILVRPAYRDLVEHSLTCLLSVCQDHPSVLAWGIGSQLDWHLSAMRDFSLWLRSLVKESDNRPCYVETNDPELTAGLADFTLIAAGIEGSGLALRKSAGDVPYLYSRIGTLASAGKRNFTGTPAGNVEQADYLLRRLAALETDDSADGFLIHCYADYHGASPLLAQPRANDPTLYTFGILSWDRQERMAYAKLRDLAQTGQSSPPAPSQTQSHPPVAFPVVGLAALLLLSVEMRRNNVFRQNLRRTFLHAHGFHSDLRYRRFLHLAQPLLLWVLEAVTIALLISSVLFALRNSLALDYYLTHFLPWPRFKAWLVDMIWEPSYAVAYFSALAMTAILVKILAVRLLSLLFKEHADFWQSANYVIWSFAAMLFLLPLAVVFYRIIDMPNLATAAYVLVAGGLLWSGLRLLSALRTGYGSSPLRVYGTILGIGGIIIILLLALLDNQLGTFTYLTFFHDVFSAQ
jgi:hypothetical protein